MAETQDSVTHVVEDSKKSLENTFIWIGILVLVFGVLIISIIKKNKPSFSISSMIFSLLILFIVSMLLIFFFKIKTKAGKGVESLQENIRVPNPVSKKDLLYKLHNEALKNIEFFNEVKEVIETTPKDIGRNLLYVFDIESLYKNKKGNYRYVIIYHANYPNMQPSILLDPSPTTVARVANSMSTSKEKIRPEETAMSYNPLTGTTTQYSKTGIEPETPNKIQKGGKLE